VGHAPRSPPGSGIDDEVGDRGSVTFEVWADGVKLADSGVRRGTDGAATLTADLTGKRELRLVVTSAADGIDYDHADWLDPQLTCAAPAPSDGTTPLSELSWTGATNAWGPVERDRSNGEQQAGDGRTLTVGGVTFAKVSGCTRAAP
jgi:alpha-galactosidase